MKTIRLIITVVAVTISLGVNAIEEPKMTLVPLTSDRAIVSVENTYPALLELSILAENGEEIYHEKSENPMSSFKKIFDFEELNNGMYTMNLKVNNRRLSREFEVAPGSIHIGSSKMRLDPYFVFADNILKFSYLNVDGEKMRLNIYSEKGLIYTKELGNNQQVSSGYDLSNLSAGKYQVVLSSFENEFNYSLTK